MPRSKTLFLFLSLASGAACGENPFASDTGTLEVTSSTQGAGLDPDGFALSLDDGPALPFESNASLTLADLSAGSHTLKLSGLAPNCTLSTPNPLSTTVPAGGIARVVFEVVCSAPGSLEVTTTTSGTEVDPDGYTVSVDNGTGLAVLLDGQVTIGDLIAGTHSVRLSGLAPNCSVAGPNPLTVAITGGGTQAVSFEVACLARPTLRVAAVTTGDEPDTQYQLQVDADRPHPLGGNASVALELAPGAHTVTLEDVAPNCAVAEANPRSVTLALGDAAEILFTVSCVPPASLPRGQILVTTHPGGLFSDPDGYTVSLDGRRTRHIGIIAEVTFTDVVPGRHSVKLGNLAPGCGFFLTNPQDVTVTSGVTARVDFYVICVP